MILCFSSSLVITIFVLFFFIIGNGIISHYSSYTVATQLRLAISPGTRPKRGLSVQFRRTISCR